ncbi:hypothetical protein PMG11_04302 [Penicillium brasilianum]|uniref:Uncharacterized protein n=1 Tax=Penicillium brasilianum TaxID=104259 RepID=A0A0F7VCE3_PENBI|nr:hypothetical protein PMG11_04302 [Penicillium brasilianum]
MIRIRPRNPQKLRLMEKFRDPQTLEALKATPNERFIEHMPGGGAPSPLNSLSDYYQRMLWLLPDEVCSHVLSGWMQLIHAKKGSSEPFPNLWLYFLDTCRLSSRSHKSVNVQLLQWFICNVVCDGAIIDELYSVMQTITGHRNAQWCRELLGGILLIRRGEIACTSGSMRIDPMNKGRTCPNQDASSLNEIQRVEPPGIETEFTIYTDLIADLGATHGVFGLGIHVWYINVIHSPYRRLPVDFQRDFLIAWQTFNLDGQPLHELREVWVALYSDVIHQKSGNSLQLLQDRMVVEKIQTSALIGRVYLVGEMSHTSTLARLSGYVGFSIRRAYTKDILSSIEDIGNWSAIPDDIRRISG